jgi:phosphoribosylformimino-5-aminoimidazole carboxamide ribotide isomerase
VLIPSIDLQGGRIVQLVQGETLALESDDLEGWVARFQRFPVVQLIDLDAAKGLGTNDVLVTRVTGRLRCRVGGGVRTLARAEELIAAGSQAIIVGSALFKDGAVDHAFAGNLVDTIGANRIICAVDSRGGRVVIHGWKTTLPITAVDAVRQLEPYCGEFLYTHVDAEGLMRGTDMTAIRSVAAATRRKVTAAGGITTQDEIDELDRMGIDAVVGMALYTGRLAI